MMRHLFIFPFLFPVAVAALILVSVMPLRAQDAKVLRGRYLVEEVGRCQECHTPKTDAGEFDRSKWLKGANLNMAPVAPIRGWNMVTPDITSTSRLWDRWTEDGLIKFMETAKNPRGGKADPPMPAYTLQHDDADAVVAYLKSLP